MHLIRMTTVATVGALAGLVGAAIGADAAPASADDAAETSWSVKPAGDEERSNFDFAAEPGDVIRDAMVVRNLGDQPLELDAYASDAYTNEQGILSLRLADEEPTDGGAWVDVADGALEIAPGATAEVPFTITVPDDAKPGDHPSGVVTSLAAVASGQVLEVDRRLGLRINLRVAGEVSPAVEVADASAEFRASANPFGGGSVVVTYTLTNTGDTRLSGNDAVALAGPAGIGGASIGSQEVPEIVPGSRVTVQRELTGVAALGWYSGSVSFVPQVAGIGAQPLDAVTVDVSVSAVSWSLIVLVVVLLVAAAMGAWLVVRRRARRAAGSAETERLQAGA